jgi:membrane dipeptidase
MGPLRRLDRAAHEVVRSTVERYLNTTSDGPLPPIRPEVLAFHRDHPVVDLLVGSALFRRRFVTGTGGGHADLPRLIAGGVDLVGLSIATRHPDLRGTLSTPHFRALGFPVSRLGSDMALVEAIVARIRRWESGSGGRLRLVGSSPDLDATARSDPPAVVRAFLGIQGGHALDGDAANVARSHALGVRMLAPAHVMDNALVGSNTGVRRAGLTGYGREIIGECERLGVVVDLAHMSVAGIRDTLPLLTRPFVLSHTGFTAISGRSSRWRSFSPANRNVSTADALTVAGAGGVIGVVLSTQLLGGEGVAAAVRSIRWAVDTLGADHVAIGSDFDGGLKMVIDARGMPVLTQALLDDGMAPETVAAVIGGNALRVLRAAFEVGRADGS